MEAKTNAPGTGTQDLYAGIDAGSVAVKGIVIDRTGEVVYACPYARHFGKVEEKIQELIRGLYAHFGPANIRSISFTGNNARKLAEDLGAFYEFENITQVLGALHVEPRTRCIISMGGQDTALFEIGHGTEARGSDGGEWELAYFNSNGPCASGTGSFIDQQAQRLATALYETDKPVSQEAIDQVLADFIALGSKSRKPAHVACRCTVFTKSDMIHLQNKGERLEDIIFGLHIGNARNYMSTIVSNRRLQAPILFIGGLTLNRLQIQAFKAYFPDLIIPPYATASGALGVALQALKSGHEGGVDEERLREIRSSRMVSLPSARKLVLQKTVFPEGNVVASKPLKRKARVYLGLDIGSTTTKYALLDENRAIIRKRYVPTQGKPIEVVKELLGELHSEWGGALEIAGTATTGSGRNVVGDFLNVDLMIDEITAHARGAVEMDAAVDTIFEIGGQDSKYIYIANTHPLDFDMNKVCAAGTGSFLHELSNKYGINIVNEFQDIALSSVAPIPLAERCTVFMESDLVSYLQRGAPVRDLMAGLCYAIVSNYLNRVVGKRRIGERIMFLGGPSLNKAVVAAFENVLGRGLLVPRHREVLGAYGAALSVQEFMAFEGKRESGFRGLASAVADTMVYEEKICHADPNCHNQCKLKIYNFDGRRSVWGGECGRYDVTRGRGEKKPNYFALRQRVMDEFLDGVAVTLKEGETILELGGRPTVGLQRALHVHQTAVLWAHFFDRLGFRLVLTPPTTPAISSRGIESMAAETCYPVKVSHGHTRMLMGRTRHLFMPFMITMETPQDVERGFYCPMVQSNTYMLQSALGIDLKKALTPTVYLDRDPKTIAMALTEALGSKLGVTFSRIHQALIYALAKQRAFCRRLVQEGDKIRGSLDDKEPLLVVTGRPYNLYDERLNLRLGQNLGKIGLTALPMDFLDVSGVDLSDFPSMYWGLGAQILRTAKVVNDHAHMFGLHLTNFECGPDSFLEHFYRYIMGDKAYLILELDEHSAVAGVMTRLEAYRNVIENVLRKQSQAVSPELDCKAAS